MTITLQLVQNCLNTKYEDIPEEVIHHAKRSLFNWAGVAIGASRHASVDILIQLKEELESSRQVSILGRSEKADLLMAALINGMSSHIFDYDDTHLDTIHHPSGPVAPVCFALGEKYRLSGKQILHAFILGAEAELRISNAVYPSHYDQGWHITSTTGVFGAAVAAGILLNLDEEKMLYALGIAGTQAFGLREMFGTMTKPFHPGKAAQNGLMAALMAKQGFTSSTQVLEGKRGFVNVYAPEHDLDKINSRWGEQWELLKNTFKPYACGIVLHPSIDACIALGNKVKDPSEVKEIRIEVNPYVLELTGKKEPKTGLEGKFSIFHTGAIAFLEGDASEEQYTDEKVLDPRTISLRTKIKPVVNHELEEDEALAQLTTVDGRVFVHKVEHATGSLKNPMSDEALHKKFRKLTEGIIGPKRSEIATEKFFALDSVADIREIVPYLTTDD